MSLLLPWEWLNSDHIVVNSPEWLLYIIKSCLEHHLQLKVVLSETWIDDYSDTLMMAVVSTAARRCSCIIVHNIAVIFLGPNFSLLAKNWRFYISYQILKFVTSFNDVTFVSAKYEYAQCFLLDQSFNLIYWLSWSATLYPWFIENCELWNKI